MQCTPKSVTDLPLVSRAGLDLMRYNRCARREFIGSPHDDLISSFNVSKNFCFAANGDASFDVHPFRFPLSHSNDKCSLKVGRDGSSRNEERRIGPLNRPFDGSKTSGRDLRFTVAYLQFNRHGSGILSNIMRKAGNRSMESAPWICRHAEGGLLALADTGHVSLWNGNDKP